METREYYTGLKRGSPDPRDLIRRYGGHEIPLTDKHPMVDLRRYIDQVYDQGHLSSCSANILCAAYALELRRQAARTKSSYSYYDPSRLFLFYNTREYVGHPEKNAGAAIRDSLKAMYKWGICRESIWPYEEQKFAWKPSFASYSDAAGNTITKYEYLDQDIHQFRACLKEGFPFAFGFELYESFYDRENETKGLMPMPSAEEIESSKYSLHGVLAVGYDDQTKRITVLNSWGESFGDKGYFYMPYKYITETDRAFDFWKIEKATKIMVTEL